MWAGIAGAKVPNANAFEIAISIHDSVYNTDFSNSVVQFPGGKTAADPEELESKASNILHISTMD